jgi:plasmid stabilization system protein ParE
VNRKHLLRWLPEAYTDLREARAWYEEQSAGLGADFVAEFWRTVSAIDHLPTVPRAVELVTSGETVRRCHFNGWPYSVVYAVEDETVIIVAVHHDRRHPQNWHRRLR